MLKAIVWLSLNIVVLSLGAAGYAQNEGEGKKLYTSYCVGCHGDRER